MPSCSTGRERLFSDLTATLCCRRIRPALAVPWARGDEKMPSYVTVYVEVEDVDAHLAKAEATGGTTVVPKQVIPGMVIFGLFNDSAGNMVGVVEAEMPPAELNNQLTLLVLTTETSNGGV